MRVGRAIAVAALCVAPLVLAGCAGGLAGSLRRAGVSQSPDEFMVLPTRPLEMPESFATLPPPKPGTVNRVDYRPHSEAIAGLTGRPAVATASGAALLARTGSGQPGIRSEVAAEDVTWRQTHHGRLLERIFARDQDDVIYRQMVLDAPAEFERMRASGARVPAATPSSLGQ
jgi:Protein of unknown function (DUF3035)